MADPQVRTSSRHYIYVETLKQLEKICFDIRDRLGLTSEDDEVMIDNDNVYEVAMSTLTHDEHEKIKKTDYKDLNQLQRKYFDQYEKVVQSPGEYPKLRAELSSIAGAGKSTLMNTIV